LEHFREIFGEGKWDEDPSGALRLSVELTEISGAQEQQQQTKLLTIFHFYPPLVGKYLELVVGSCQPINQNIIPARCRCSAKS
jgi:hypothetical protein